MLYVYICSPSPVMVVMAYGPCIEIHRTSILQRHPRHLRTEPLPALVQKIWLPGWCILGLARAQRITPESHGMIQWERSSHDFAWKMDENGTCWTRNITNVHREHGEKTWKNMVMSAYVSASWPTSAKSQREIFRFTTWQLRLAGNDA